MNEQYVASNKLKKMFIKAGVIRPGDKVRKKNFDSKTWDMMIKDGFFVLSEPKKKEESKPSYKKV